MATQEDPSEHLNYKTWVLKVSIHCEGCKRKVKKILQQVPGVCTIDIDLKQQKAIVTGNVEGETLLRKLHKSGKHAELLLPPQQPDLKDKKSSKTKNKEKQIEPPIKEADVPTAKVVVPQEPSVKIQDPKKSEKSSTGSTKPEDETGSIHGGEPGAQGNEGGGEKGNSVEAVNESKSEGKKPVTESAGKQPVAAEGKVSDSDNASVSGEKSGRGPGIEASGNIGKKKKKKGQNSNDTESTQSSDGPEFQHHNMGPQVSGLRNDSPPRQQGHHYYPQQGPHFNYGPPPAYVVSYNTSQPTSTYTASYYAPTPPTSYAYTYSGPGPVTHPPPSDVDYHPRQPLDSFEMFSDENPNGCSIM